MAGRKPKPSGLKDLLGNPGKRALNEAEPRPTGEAAKPKFLKGRAARVWDEYHPQLTKLGVLTAVDAHTFAAWCCLVAEFESGPERMTASRIAQMRALGSSFGLDASSRSRLSVKDDGQNQDPADKYFGGGAAGPGKAVLQ